MAVNNTKMRMIKKSSCLSNKMGARTMEVSAVGAWVQPANNSSDYEDAVRSAHIEEERVRRQQAEKVDRLQAFQEGVRQRMQLLAVAKRARQCQKSYTPVDMVKPLSNWTTVRNENAAHGPCNASIIMAQSTAEDKTSQQFEEHKNKIHSYNKHARQNLISWKIADGTLYTDDLPGGIWKTGATLDRPHLKTPPFQCSVTDNDVVHIVDNTTSVNRDVSGEQDVKIVHFEAEIDKEETRQERINRKSAPLMSGTELQRALSVPVLRPVDTEDRQEAAQRQRALYRRVYMDLERQQVKEKQRVLQHRHNINRLKRDKEEERNRVELLARQQAQLGASLLTAGSDDGSGREEEEREREEAARRREEAGRRRAQKAKETERFVEALKRQLKEKVQHQHIDLPPLCCCAPSVWLTNPLTCANNCVFYKNPRAYTKALQSLLSSCEVL